MKKYIIGNWKMNQSLDEITHFLKAITSHTPSEQVEIGISPQLIHLHHCLKNSPHFLNIGSQNCSQYLQGAYTGEVSPQALKELGTHFTLVGHSERRTLYGETNKEIALKTITALKTGLKVILCIGETLEQRESNQTLHVIKEQIDFLKNIPHTHNLLIAYEPVWAIGTGLSATANQAQEVHQFIRKTLSEFWEKSLASQTPLLYGGSVKPDNIKELMTQGDINGALVGGASLKAESFIKLYDSF